MREMKTEFLPTFASYYRILVNQYLDQNHYDHDLRCQPTVWTWRGSDVKAWLIGWRHFPSNLNTIRHVMTLLVMSLEFSPTVCFIIVCQLRFRLCPVQM